MGLLIPHLKLPKACSECIFTKEKLNFRRWCIFKPSICVDDYEFTRHHECPLTEITNNFRCEHVECTYKQTCNKNSYEMTYCTAYLDV